MENEYVTYSKIFGVHLASSICLVIHLAYLIGLIYVGILLEFSLSHLLLQSAIILYVLFVHLRFIINPIEKYQILKKTSEMVSAVSTIIYLVYMIIQFGMEWRWF